MAVEKPNPDKPPISLKQLAEHLNLSPATISLVVNSAPGMKSIALATRARVLAAAKELNYRPNSLARSLRTRQTFTIGVIAPELSEGYFTLVMNAVEAHFLQAGYLHFVVTHQGQPDLIQEYPRLLLNRYVDGLGTWAPLDPGIYRERAAQIVFSTLLWHQQGKAISVC